MNLLGSITFVVVLVFLQAQCIIVTEIYVREGNAINLTFCPIKSEIASLTWRGPPNLTVYSSGTKRRNKTNVRVIHDESTRENILEISKFEAKNEGLYQCISFYGGDDSFHLRLLPVPRFASNNTPEHYINFNQPNEFKVYFIAHPIANVTVLEDNKLDLGLRRCDMCISVNKATVADIIYNKLVNVIGYEINIRIFIGKQLNFSNITVVLQNDRGWSNYTIKVKAARQYKAPAHITAIALETKIILKWRADFETRIETNVFVEYCKYFESEWSQVATENTSTAVIDRLEPDTVYFLRLYFKIVTGESSRTDTVIAKTEKVRILVTEFALLFETLLLVICMCWCGLKALKKRQSRNNNRVSPSQRNEEPSVRAHYDEINSIYYNPINVTISPQSTSSTAQFENSQPSISNANFENNESDTNKSSNQSNYWYSRSDYI